MLAQLYGDALFKHEKLEDHIDKVKEKMDALHKEPAAPGMVPVSSKEPEQPKAPDPEHAASPSSGEPEPKSVEPEPS